MMELILAILAFGGGYFIRFHQDKLQERERVRRRLEELHQRLLELSHHLRDAWCDLSVDNNTESRQKLISDTRTLLRDSLPVIGHLQQVHANELCEKGSELYNAAAAFICLTAVPNAEIQPKRVEDSIDYLAKISQDHANEVLSRFAVNSPAWLSTISFDWAFGKAFESSDTAKMVPPSSTLANPLRDRIFPELGSSAPESQLTVASAERVPVPTQDKSEGGDHEFLP